jgi:triosephosphate isomerase
MNKKTQLPRGFHVAGNWKMHHGPQATGGFFRELAALGDFETCPQIRSYLFPPALSLQQALDGAAALQKAFPANPALGALRIGAQNAHGAPAGAFTGELSGPMLRELGVGTVLIGHSERRQLFGETDSTARARAEGLIAQGFEVLYCIGENREQRESNATFSVLEEQLSAIRGLAASGKLLLAYEPVWAIGTGLQATPWQAQEAHAFIRSFLAKFDGEETAQKTPILYGGSVTPATVAELMLGADVDGVLVGGASLRAESFRALLATLPDRSA